MKLHPLVSAEWLNNHLNDSELVILDATIPKAQGNQTSTNENVQIPGTRFFNLKDVFSDQTSDLPNTMPSPEVFEGGCRQLGINNSSKIVIYDRQGIYSSPRAWWMFKVMGHEQVQVLDGGFPEWMKLGLTTEDRVSHEVVEGDFKATYRQGQVKTAEDVLANIDQAQYKILDARSKGRFKGTTPEPRKGLKGGHIPGSLSLPYTKLLKDGKFIAKAELTPIIQELNLGDHPLIFSCGSGITACVILLACDIVLDNEKSVYDGSWTEWGDPHLSFPISN